MNAVKTKAQQAAASTDLTVVANDTVTMNASIETIAAKAEGNVDDLATGVAATQANAQAPSSLPDAVQADEAQPVIKGAVAQQPDAAPKQDLPANPQAPTPSSASLIDKLGLKGLSYAGLMKLAQEAANEAGKSRKKEQDDFFASLAVKMTDLGLTTVDLVENLTKARTSSGPAAHSSTRTATPKPSTDKAGAKPEVGATYKHPVTGQTWKKIRPQGSAKKEFVELILQGKTWKELRI